MVTIKMITIMIMMLLLPLTTIIMIMIMIIIMIMMVTSQLMFALHIKPIYLAAMYSKYSSPISRFSGANTRTI